MKTTIAIASLLATGALAKPLVHNHQKRHWDFDVEVDTVYTTVTATGTHGGWSWGSWGSWGGAATSTADAVPVVTETPLDESPAPTPAPVTTEAPMSAWPTATAAPAPPPAAPPAAPSPATSGAPSWTSSASVSQGTGPGGVDIAAILDQHNGHRRNTTNDTPDLVWSTDMANIAAEIAASCVYAHNTAAGGGGYGQNIGAGAPPSDIPAMITNEMYNGEINFYPTPYGNDNPDMSNFEQWGHYSQIVWKSTTAVGCASQYCPNGLANAGSGVSPYFTVCNYSPPGNFGGQYSNVGQPGSEASVTV